MAKATTRPDPDLDAKLDAVMPLVAQAAETLGAAIPAELQYMSAPPGPQIYRRIIQVMRAVSHVGKTGYNEQQRYSFRGIDAAVNALGPAMREYGLFALPEILEANYRDTLTTQDKKTREVTVRVRYTFYAEDGSNLPVVVNGESLDTSDKGTAKAMSVAYRIALLQLFALPTDEPTTDHDGNYHTRTGRAGMSNWEKETGRALLVIPTPEQRYAAGRDMMAAAFGQACSFTACIVEHDAVDQPTDGEGSATWAEVVAARVAAEIDAAETAEALKIVYDTAKANDCHAWAHEGKPNLARTTDRLIFLRERTVKTFDHCMAGVLAADDLECLSQALGCAVGARDAEVISPEQFSEINAVFVERRVRLEGDLNQPGEPGRYDGINQH